jgi:hypothetical protein
VRGWPIATCAGEPPSHVELAVVASAPTVALHRPVSTWLASRTQSMSDS